MSEEIDALKGEVDHLKVSVAEVVDEVHKLADQIAALSADKPEVVALTADVKAAADTLHGLVFPPSAAHE